MSRREPAVGRDLVPDEAPSPEVLDELLRAFSADLDDHERLAAVDLTSPEVDALLTPPAGTSDEAGGDDDAGSEVGEGTDQPADLDDRADQGEPADEDDAADHGVDDPARAEVEELAVAPPLDAAAPRNDLDPGIADDLAPVDDIDPDADGSAELDGDLATTPTEGGGVTGDPLLGATVGVVDGLDGDGTSGSMVRIVDDELPDAVYMSGSLEPAAPARPTVFIDGGEDADGSTITMDDATSAAHIEPRLRDRRIAVKRAAGRKRLKWALAITLVFVVVVAALAVLGSGLFAIDEVRIEGAEQTDEDALAAILADLEGRPVLRVDTEAIEARLKELPWVDDARVTTDFPDGATIELRERTAVATVEDREGGWSVIDADGRVLAASEQQPEGLPVITVADLPVVEVAKFAPQGVGAAATLIGSLTPLIEASTETVIVTPDGSDLRLTLTGGTEVRFGAAEDIVQKLVRLQTMLIDTSGPPYTYIDVSTNDIGTG